VSQSYTPDPEHIRRWSDRHTGVGFDQLLVVAPPEDPEVDFRYIIFNADGTEAEQCGNGARCVARFVRDSGLSVKEQLRFQTSNSHIETTLKDGGLVEVDMGVPGLAPETIPCKVEEALRQVGEDSGARFELAGADGEAHELSVVSIGNPHGVLRIEEISEAPVERIGASLTIHPFFPEQANIGFCHVVDAGFIRLRVFERGVGETRACGTGACAAVVAGRLAGVLDERVKVSLPGGKVRIRWQGPDTPVKMTGPATMVYEGHLAVD
ncbi:MAG: diaminopimelate epimerase, partial [Pseudomonadota bacterium]